MQKSTCIKAKNTTKSSEGASGEFSRTSPRPSALEPINFSRKSRKEPILSPYKGRKFKKIQISIKAVEQYSIESLSMYLKLKRFYNNSIIYNYNPRAVGNRTNDHPAIIGRYIQGMLNEGLAHKEGKNLRLLSLRKVNQYINDKGDCVLSNQQHEIRIGYKTTISYIKDQVAFIALRNSEQQQKYVRELRKHKRIIANGSQTSTISLNDIKNVKRYEKKYRGLGNEAHDEPIITSRNFASILNISLGSSNKYLKNFVKHGWLKSEQIVVKIAFIDNMPLDELGLEDARFFLNELRAERRFDKKLQNKIGGAFGYFYNYKGNLYLHRGTKFDTCTPKNKRISQRFKKEQAFRSDSNSRYSERKGFGCNFELPLSGSLLVQ